MDHLALFSLELVVHFICPTYLWFNSIWVYRDSLLPYLHLLTCG